MFQKLRNTFLLGALMLFFAMASSAVVLSQEAKGPMDENAMAILKSMSDYVAKAKTLSFRAKTFYDVVRETGIKIKAGRESWIKLKRPNLIQATAIGDDGSAVTAWYDGSAFTVWRRTANEKMILKFAGSTDELLDELIDKHDFDLPLADLLYSNLNETFSQDIISSEYIGIRIVDGVPCHQLSFESKGADWQIWIEADATPLPRRFAIDFVTRDSQPQFLAQLDAWSVDGDIEDFNFKATVPESVKEVAFEAGAAKK